MEEGVYQIPGDPAAVFDCLAAKRGGCWQAPHFLQLGSLSCNKKDIISMHLFLPF